MDDTSAEREWLAEVGMRVRVARVRRRETQEQLAARAAVSRVTLGTIERGDHEAGVSTYARLARILGLQLDELLKGAP
jgi:transcriptional regulator with XRE-family HTH domain